MMNHMLFILLLCLPVLVLAGDEEWAINWHSIDGGGDLFSEDDKWELSGTIGQWDAAQPSTTGEWTLTGGFWAFRACGVTGLIFRDRFEE